MTFVTIDQLISIMQSQKCCACDQKATWIPEIKGLGYCDTHFPYDEYCLKCKNESVACVCMEEDRMLDV